MENQQGTSVAPPPTGLCVSTQSQCVDVLCQNCKSEARTLERGPSNPPVHRHKDTTDDSSTESSTETTDSSSTSEATSLLNAGDTRGYGDFVNEDAWLDRMLEQLGLPPTHFQEGHPSMTKKCVQPQEITVNSGTALNDMEAEVSYHKELRDVLWTILSLKLDDMRVAASQMRAAWKSYVRNTKIVHKMLQSKERTVQSLKEQLMELEVENKVLKERICDLCAHS